MDPAVADKVILLMIAGLRHQAVVDACREKLQIPPERIEEAIDTARRRITRAAEYDRDEVLGEAINRLDDLYQRALRVQDVKTALAAQREKDRLLLGAVAPSPDPPAEPGDADGDPARADGMEHAELAALVRAIEEALDLLDLDASDADLTDADVIRLAGLEIQQHRNRQKRAKAKKAKAKKGTTR